MVGRILNDFDDVFLSAFCMIWRSFVPFEMNKGKIMMIVFVTYG